MATRGPITVNRAGAKALAGSIKKWELIVAGIGPDNGRKNCPLCHRYFSIHKNYDDDTECHGCPIYQATGRQFCDGTPHEDYIESELLGNPSLVDARRFLNWLRRLQKRTVVISARREA
jgi:hypothetical protein